MPEQPLRWLRPLHRPTSASYNQILQQQQQQQQTSPPQVLKHEDQPPQHAHAPVPSQEATQVDTPMAEALPAMLHHHQLHQAYGGVSQADGFQAALQHAQQPQAGGIGDDAERDDMQIDGQPASTQKPAALHDTQAELNMQSLQQQLGHADQHQQGPPQLQQGQPQLQQGQSLLPDLAPYLQARVHENVAKCDRQLLGRQEALMVRWLLQSIEEEVTAKYGAADIDDSAAAYVQQVGTVTAVLCAAAQSMHEQICDAVRILSRMTHDSQVMLNYQRKYKTSSAAVLHNIYNNQ